MQKLLQKLRVKRVARIDRIEKYEIVNRHRFIKIDVLYTLSEMIVFMNENLLVQCCEGNLQAHHPKLMPYLTKNLDQVIYRQLHHRPYLQQTKKI